MCVVSMIADHYKDRLPQQYQWVQTWPDTSKCQGVGPTQAEFDALKAEVENLKALLKRAKDYDEKNNEPDCETEEKMDLLRKVAKMVGVDLGI